MHFQFILKGNYIVHFQFILKGIESFHINNFKMLMFDRRQKLKTQDSFVIWCIGLDL